MVTLNTQQLLLMSEPLGSVKMTSALVSAAKPASDYSSLRLFFRSTITSTDIAQTKRSSTQSPAEMSRAVTSSKRTVRQQVRCPRLGPEAWLTDDQDICLDAKLLVLSHQGDPEPAELDEAWPCTFEASSCPSA
jgi:hypothetical protein